MRKNRIYHLNHMASCQKNEFYDKVFFYPGTKDPVHMWLISPCTTATILLDHFDFVPRNSYTLKDYYAVDYGVFDYPTGDFSQLKIKSICFGDLQDSFLIITNRLDWQPSGDIEAIERALWGLSRSDAGCSMITPSTVIAGTPTEFCVYYRPNIKLPAGSRLRFGIPFAFDYPQVDYPLETGYVSVYGDYHSLLSTQIVKGVEGHERVYVYYELDKDLLPNQIFELHYTTNHVYLYPQTYSENEMEFWYTRSPVLNVSVSYPGYHDFVFLSDKSAHHVTFVAGKPEKLHLFMPGRLHCGEKITLHGLFTDCYHNPCNILDRPDFKFDLYIQYFDDTKQRLVEVVTYTDFNTFYVALSLTKPGVYRILAIDTEGKLLAESNPFQLLDYDDPRSNIYWGDIHVHSGMSDGIGTYQQLFHFGRDIAALDFVAAADHACYFSDNEWETMQDICNSFNQDGRFTTLVGYEWAGKQVHRNIYTAKDRLELFRGMYEPTSTLNTVYDYFHGNEDIVAGPHGSLAHGLLFEYHDATVERFIEIYSMWGNQDRPDREHAPVRLSPKGIAVNDLIKKGFHLGFTGGGDCHEAHPGFSSCDLRQQGAVPHAFAQLLRYRCGLTASCISSLNRKSLVDAIRNRKTYATTGTRLLADFTVNSFPMGSVTVIQGTHCEIWCEYHLIQNTGTISVIRNGEEIYTENIINRDAEFTWSDRDCIRNETSYYVKIIQADKQTLWTSPVWIIPVSHQD